MGTTYLASSASSMLIQDAIRTLGEKLWAPVLTQTIKHAVRQISCSDHSDLFTEDILIVSYGIWFILFFFIVVLTENEFSVKHKDQGSKEVPHGPVGPNMPDAKHGSETL